jgi:hypothetical protein
MAARTTIKIPEEALEVLRRSTITATTVELPPGQLDRKIYETVDKALRAAGGKWNRSKRVHIFDRDPREALGLTLATGTAVNHQQVKQAFYTPDALADRLVEGLDIHPGNVILEPSCGDGALIRAIHRRQPEALVDAIDTDDQALATIAADPRVRASVHDFLALPVPIVGFDFVVMNPPFTKGQDIAHVTHARRFLHQRGVLVAITGTGWRFAENAKAKAFRALLAKLDHDIEEIEAGAFKASGTTIPTLKLTIRP